MSVVVDEPVGGRGGVVEGSGEHGGHLSAGHGPFGAEPVGDWWVASGGDSGGGEAVDVVFEEGVVVVGEVVGGGGWQGESAGEEGGHLLAVDCLVGAVAVVGWWVAASGDVGGGDRFD